MPRIKSISGTIVTVTEVKGLDESRRHWFMVYGTAQGISDYLNEQGVPEHKVKSISFVSSIWYAWYHK